MVKVREVLPKTGVAPLNFCGIGFGINYFGSRFAGDCPV